MRERTETEIEQIAAKLTAQYTAQSASPSQFEYNVTCELQAVSDRAVHETRKESEKEIAILKLAVPIQDELQDRIDAMLADLATEQGFTLSGIARLLVDCQRRMAADWSDIGRLQRTINAAIRAAASLERDEREVARLIKNAVE